MVVEIAKYKPPERKKEKPPRRANEIEAREIFRKKIEQFIKSPDSSREKQSGVGLLYFDTENDTLISAPGRKVKKIDRNIAQNVLLEVIKGYGFDETKYTEDVRPETDPIDFRVQQGNYTQYRLYPTRIPGLVFERMLVVRGDRPGQVRWTTEGSVMARARRR